jgi:alanyl-tRNA synthetase
VATGLAGQAADVGGAAYVAHRLPDATPADGIRKLALDVRGQIPPSRPGVVIAAAVTNDRPSVVVAVNEAAQASGIKAGALISIATAALGGRGGGRDDIAQGGGAVLGDQTDRSVQEAFSAVRAVIADIMAAGSVT